MWHAAAIRVLHRPEERRERRLSPTAVLSTIRFKDAPRGFFPTITIQIQYIHTIIYTHTPTYKLHIKPLINYYKQIR